MAEDWTTLLTEKEQRRLVARSKYCHGRGLAHACCDELPGFLRSLAASRALVAAKEKRLQRRSEDWHDEMKHKGDWIECSILTCSVDREALALAESDMLERLEVK